MAMDVSEETRERTDKCWRGFVCLSDEEFTVCSVRDSVEDLIFVERETEKYCSYDVTFGFSYICSCPVRAEIYERYEE